LKTLWVLIKETTISIAINNNNNTHNIKGGKATREKGVQPLQYCKIEFKF